MKKNEKSAERKDSKKITFGIKKEEEFSDWFTEIVKKAELADLRYNVKGFLVFQPWSVLAMEKIYDLFESALQRKGHKPYWFPALIPEKNFFIEQEHVQGFVPEVFWVTEHGDGEKFEEKLALRPTSETVFYQMFSYWIRSYKDLPFKTYQRAQVWRYETKATRPFLRGREFYWIETHTANSSEEEARKQVLEDMDTTREVLFEELGVPFIFFERPQWDKFAGADSTFAADVILPNGRVLQLPSTHLLGTHFSKPFNVKFVDEKGAEKFVHNTCYGPAVSRIFAGMAIVHGDEKGLRFPFKAAPVQIMIVPILGDKDFDKKILENCGKLKKALGMFRVEIDEKDAKPGEKYYFWEMKGVPIRLEIGKKELEKNEATLFRRDLNSRETIKSNNIEKEIERIGKEITENLKKQAMRGFVERIVNAITLEELKKIAFENRFGRANFCSIEKQGEKCAELIEKEFGLKVRGIKASEKEKVFGNCIVCGKKASAVVYIGKDY